MQNKRNGLDGAPVSQIYGREDAMAVRPFGSHGGSERESEGLSLLRHIATLRRRKWLLLAVVVTVFALATLELFTMTPLYRATARLQLDSVALDILPYREVDQSVQRRQSSQQYVMTQLEQLRSQELAERVVEELNLGEDLDFQTAVLPGRITRLKADLRNIPRDMLKWIRRTPRPAPKAAESPTQPTADHRISRRGPLARRLRGGISVSLVPGTRLAEVTYSSPVPETAAKIANAVADSYVTLHSENGFLATAKASKFLRSELDQLQVNVERSEAALLAYAKDKTILNLSDRDTVNSKKLSDLNDELTRVESDLISQRSLLQAIEGGEFPHFLQDQRVRTLESQLSSHEADLAQKSSRYGPEWPTVKALNRKIEILEQQLEQSKRQAVSSLRQEYGSTQRHLNQLQTAIAEQRHTVEQLDNDSIQYNILKREAESNQELYKGLLLRLNQANVEAGLESGNIEVVERAVVPGAIAVPKKMQGLRRALMIGLLLGLVAVAVAEMLDRSIKTPEDVRHSADLPTLGSVPKLSLIDDEGSAGRSRRRRKAVDARPILVNSGKEFLRGQQWEAYRSLRTSLLLSASERPPQVVLVTSPGPAEGKTTTAMNLALAFAQNGEPTLLLEFDLRKPVLAGALKLSGRGGVSTYLTGNEKLVSQVVQTVHDGLFVVPAGPIPPNPPELISSSRMQEVMKFAREQFAHVVIDSPPVLELSDSRLLARHADGVILVARAGSTPKPALRKASEQLFEVGATMLGVVLNDSCPEAGGYGYGYGSYGSYGGYYDRAASESEHHSEQRSA